MRVTRIDLNKVLRSCNCVPASNIPEPDLRVVSFTASCEHDADSGGTTFTPEEVWGADSKDTRIFGFLSSVLEMLAENPRTRRVSEFSFTYELAEGGTHTAILEYQPEGTGLPVLMWNQCPEQDGGYHSYVDVMEWALHFAAVEIISGQVD